MPLSPKYILDGVPTPPVGAPPVTPPTPTPTPPTRGLPRWVTEIIPAPARARGRPFALEVPVISDIARALGISTEVLLAILGGTAAGIALDMFVLPKVIPQVKRMLRIY